MDCLTLLYTGFVQAMEFWKNYGILKRKFHIWKNYGIWAKRPYLWKSYGIFVLVGKKVRALFKKWGENTLGLWNVVSMFVALVITSLGLALRTSWAIALASAEWIPARLLNIVSPLSRLRQQVLMSYWLRRWLFSHSRSRPVTVTLPEATQGPSTGNWLLQSVPLRPPPLFLCPSPGILIWLFRLCHSPHSAPSSSLGPRSRFNWVPWFVSLCPLRRSTPSAVSARKKWGHNGLNRLCHITCFFMSTIQLRPGLSRALLLSLFSMPDKSSGCRLFRFFPRKIASFRFSDYSSPIPI